MSNAIYLTHFPCSSVMMANLIYITYIGVYTPAKRVTPYNTHYGAISGSLPPVLGFIASGATLSLPVLCLGHSLIIPNPMPLGLFFYMAGWQYQHFYGILWKYQSDYE